MGDPPDVVVVREDLDAHLRDEVDLVFRAAVHLGVAPLAIEAPDLRDGETFNADVLQGVFDLIELERLDDADNQFHVASVLSSDSLE